MAGSVLFGKGPLPSPAQQRRVANPCGRDRCPMDAIWVRVEGVNIVIRIRTHIVVRIWFQRGTPNTWGNFCQEARGQHPGVPIPERAHLEGCLTRRLFFLWVEKCGAQRMERTCPRSHSRAFEDLCLGSSLLKIINQAPGASCLLSRHCFIGSVVVAPVCGGGDGGSVYFGHLLQNSAEMTSEFGSFWIHSLVHPSEGGFRDSLLPVGPWNCSHL